MKKTQILDQSRKLFNEKGVANVTIRQIAKAMNMSSGNLNYHFKKRKDILEALYESVEEQENQLVEELKLPGITNGRYKKLTLRLMEKMVENRFAWLDAQQLSRESVKLKRRQKKVFENRNVLPEKEREFLNKWMFDVVMDQKRFSHRTTLAKHKEFLEIGGGIS